MTSITIGSGITSIGDYAFYYCSSLTSITLPESLTSIGDFVFYNNGLTSINIPDAVTSIGYGAFDACRKLTSINIPNAVTSIEATAFMNCSSLARVDCLPTTPPMLGERAFDAVSADCKIYVPAGTYDAYVNAEGWADYKDMIVNP